MKRLVRILIPLLLAALACNLAVNQGATPANERPRLENERPSVIFISPTVGERYALGATVLLHAQAQDVGAGVVKVEFYDNFDALIGAVNATNPAGDALLNAIFPWQPPVAQTHFVRAKALRADGTASTVAEVSIEVVAAPAGVIVPAASPTTSTGSINPTAAVVQAPPPVQAAATSTPEAQAAAVGQGGGEAEIISTEESSPPPARLSAVVMVEAANVRVEPSTTAAIALPAVTAGTTLELVWRTPDSQWAAIELPGGGFAWIFIPNTLQVNGDITTLPVATTQQ